MYIYYVAIQHKSYVDSNCNWRFENDPQRELKRELKELKIGGQTEPIQSIVLLRIARILRRVLETCEDLLSLRLNSKEPPINPCVKNLQSEKIINRINDDRLSGRYLRTENNNYKIVYKMNYFHM